MPAIDTRAQFRHVFQPRPDRLPRWMWRVWAWL